MGIGKLEEDIRGERCVNDGSLWEVRGIFFFSELGELVGSFYIVFFFFLFSFFFLSFFPVWNRTFARVRTNIGMSIVEIYATT